MKRCYLLLTAYCLLPTAYCLLLTAYCYAEEPPVSITSDYLEHESKKSIYTAKGSVIVQQDGTTIKAMEMRYEDKTDNVFADGDVRYEDDNISIKAEQAEYNLRSKTGIFYNAEVFVRQENLYISASEIEKTGEKEYLLKDASFTTCDASPPAWCFKGKKVDLIIGDRLKAKDVTFHIKEFPVFYTPYLWAPVLTERKTGFLTPDIGYSRKKGINYRQPFFWAIDDNEDATFVIDWYSRRGLGKGLEYRYVGKGGIDTTNWFYHINDNISGRNFYELRSSSSKRSTDGISAYLNLNLLSGKNFYREFGRNYHERIMRFLESTAEVSLPSDYTRAYLTSQYLIDLKDGSHTSEVVQRLPEAGYVVNPYKIGPVIFSLTSSVSNLWREEGVSGQRIDLYPKFSHSSGDKIIIFQTLGLRKTAYLLHRNEDEGFKDSVQRDILDYSISASSRILKNYNSFTHVIEPSIAYTFIPWIKREKTNLPLFDSTELYSEQSNIQLSLLNRIFDRHGEFLTLNISGSYNSYGGDTPFAPLTAAVSVVKPIQLRGDASYNTYTGQIESINSNLSIGIMDVAFSLGERYNKNEDNIFYDIGMNYVYSKNLSTEARLWYDAKGGGVRDATVRMKYQRQCWGITVAINKRLDDYSIYIMFDLLGLGSWFHERKYKV
jgi:LPS-assembly protein